jgi:ferredoxin-type protein NapF
MERRNFFKNLTKSVQKKENSIVIRPPYFLDEELFSKCIECEGSCATVCEEEIITIAEDKTPHISFEKSGCTFCDECAKACPLDVLTLEAKQNIAVCIEIDQLKCMSWSKNICFSCKDPCLDNAIEFHGMFYPEIIAEKCTSCGFCIRYCPTEAIIIKPLVKKEEDEN